MAGSVGLFVGAVVTGCGAQGPSVAAYCDYFYAEGAELRQRYEDVGEQAGSDPLAAIGSLFAAPTELGKFFSELAKRAPDDIRPDIEIVAEGFGVVADDTKANLGNPFRGLMQGLFGGMSSAPAARRVDDYTLEHCGPPPS